MDAATRTAATTIAWPTQEAPAPAVGNRARGLVTLGAMLVVVLLQGFHPLVVLVGVPLAACLMLAGVAAANVLLMGFGVVILALGVTHVVPVAVFILVTALIAVVTMRSSSIQRGGKTAALWSTGLVIAVLLLAGAAGGAGKVTDVPARPGDLRLVAVGWQFDPAIIHAPDGRMSIHLRNVDSVAHTFTVDELGIDVELPPGQVRRVSAHAAPGQYHFYCRPHAESMNGTLIVRAKPGQGA